MKVSDPRAVTVDAAAIGGGLLVVWANAAERLVPILTAIFLLLSILWLLWRMVDKVRGRAPVADEGDA